MWDDTLINDSFTDGAWSVGVMYHERRCFFCAGKGSHRIDLDWETAEWVLTYQLGKSTAGEPAQCTFPDWRPVSGQKPGKWRGFYNSGYITRISVGIIDTSKPAGHRCDGQ
jgi:hypothetical protein